MADITKETETKTTYRLELSEAEMAYLWMVIGLFTLEEDAQILEGSGHEDFDTTQLWDTMGNAMDPDEKWLYNSPVSASLD